ncbi:MAG: IS4 family transposase [Candidatus Peregrinibacteria bacterium]
MTPHAIFATILIMNVCGQHFSKSVLSEISGIISAEPEVSRRELSRRVCQIIGWRSPNGRLKDMSCRKALLVLERRGILDLPPRKPSYGLTPLNRQAREVDIPDVQCSLRQLGEIIIEPIDNRFSIESKDWFSLLDNYHYLGSGPLCGGQIRYVVKSAKHGYLGALAFTSAAWAMAKRDEYIGWSQNARIFNLQHVVSNARFLILPTVKVKNLASHVLAQALSRLPADWERRYNVRPVLVETFVDPTRFDGACYKAANWTYIGDTAGRRDGIRKNIFVIGLCSDWREQLCREPEIRLGDRPGVESPANWAEEEFGTVRFNDDRLKKRLYIIAQDFFNQTQENVPQACGSKARTMGAYRFFQNSKVTMDVILTAHTEAAIKRIKEHPIVLAPQDTTPLNYSTHSKTKGLGPIHNKKNKAVGLILHDTLAFTEDGVPLGVLDGQCWARDPKDKGKSDRRKGLPIEQKESMKWLRSYRRVAEIQQVCPQTMLVSMGDRESDIYELFDEARHTINGPELLIRAEKTRKRKVVIQTEEGEGKQFLWDFMDHQPISGALQIHIPRTANRQARDARIDVRFAKVNIAPPKNFSKHSPIPVWVVYALEAGTAPNVIKPVSWMLMTTVPVNNFQDAAKRVEWYTRRWGIEVYHRTLKSGCLIKNRQFGKADRITTCLGIDMVVAWRVYHLTMLGRVSPDSPCTAFFNDIEWKALCIFTSKNPVPPTSPPSMRDAVRMVGATGGHLGRKGDGHPGTQTVWKGLQRLDSAVEMYALLTNQSLPPPEYPRDLSNGAKYG